MDGLELLRYRVSSRKKFYFNDEHGYFSTFLQLLIKTTLQQYLSKRQTRYRLYESCNAEKGTQRAIQKT